MTLVSGTVSTGFEPVRAAFAQGQQNDEGGAQLCVYRHGRLVVDLWAGRDVIKNRPYRAGTITIMMSCSKASVAACAHILAERGLLDFDAPVARYWPEFGAAGKANIRVRHLLSHSAGLMGYDPEAGIGADDVLDWRTSTEALARMTPLWEPGTAYFYHFVTFGFLVGEVIRRVSGKSVGRFFADEIARPLKLDMWIGLPESEEDRVAPHFTRLTPLNQEQWRAFFAAAGIDVSTRLARTLLDTFKSADGVVHRVMNTPPGHAAEIPAGNAIGNARALARMYAGLISDVDGVRLIRAETMERARTPETAGLGSPGDLAKFSGRTEPQRFGLGFELPRAPEPMFGPGSFGHAGAGGRMGFAHPESGIAVGYVCNNMLWNNLEPDARWVPWTKALHDAVAG